MDCLAEFFDEDEDAPDYAEVVLALLKDFDLLKVCLEEHREEIQGLKRKIAELENRPMAVTIDNASADFAFDQIRNPDLLRYTITCNR
jgi:hypothetical protein